MGETLSDVTAAATSDFSSRWANAGAAGGVCPTTYRPVVELLRAGSRHSIAVLEVMFTDVGVVVYDYVYSDGTTAFRDGKRMAYLSREAASEMKFMGHRLSLSYDDPGVFDAVDRCVAEWLSMYPAAARRVR